MNLVKKGMGSIFKDGVRLTWRKFKKKLAYSRAFSIYMNEHKLSDFELKQQREAPVHDEIVFSIVVALHNTPLEFLKEMIDSVVGQTYSLWQLCLADGSDPENSDVEKFCREYSKKDSRIFYKRLKNNLGISGNTNAALKFASGSYIALLDHDDLLAPSALYECAKTIAQNGADVVYTDEMTFEGELKNVVSIHFKPDFSPDTLLSHNYICHFFVYSRELGQKVGAFSEAHDGSQDYDMILKITEIAKNIVHIPKVLYFWRSHPMSVASDVKNKPYCMKASKKAILDHLQRTGKNATVEDSNVLSTYKVNYKIIDNPKISILIPNKDNISYLSKCIDSIQKKSNYSNFEIVIIENNSEKNETKKFYSFLKNKDPRIKIIEYDGGFNYSKINNFGSKFASGDYLLLLNNDTEVISKNWLEEMLMFAQREDVGAVGAKLYYADNSIQHAGVIVGIAGSAGHAHRFFSRNSSGYLHRASIVQNLSAVTGACLMTKRKVWEQMQGLDEKFAVAFNDVDFCLRLRKAGYLVIFTPYSELYHYESKSRGYEDTPEKKLRFSKERDMFRKRWKNLIERGDPYYNSNLSLDSEDFRVKI